MGISTSPHGIGSIIQEINNEYQNEYNTTENLIEQGDSDVTFNQTVIQNSGAGGNPYAVISKELKKDGSFAGPYFPSVDYGPYVETVGSFTQFDTITPAVDYPNDLAVSPVNGDILIDNNLSGDQDLQIIGRDGSLKTHIHGDNAYSAAFHPINNTIWSQKEDLVQYDYEGNELNRITPSGNVDSSLVVDFDGTLWHGDQYNNTLYHLDPSDGSLIETIPGPDDIDGLTIDWRDGTFWANANGTLEHRDRTTSNNIINTYAVNVGDGISFDPLDCTLWSVPYAGDIRRYSLTEGGRVYNGSQGKILVSV